MQGMANEYTWKTSVPFHDAATETVTTHIEPDDEEGGRLLFGDEWPTMRERLRENTKPSPQE